MENVGNELTPEKDNYLHCLRHYLDMCRDSQLFYMSMLICRLIVQYACQCTN